jgi:hypothetical protein
VANLRWLQVTDDALAFALWVVVDHELDRDAALDRTTGAAPRRRTSCVRSAQVVIEGLLKAHPNHVALVRSQTGSS